MANVIQPAIQGHAHIFGINIVTFYFMDALGNPITGWAMPNYQSLKLRHMGTVEKIKNSVGHYTSIISSGEFLECEFEFIPEGASTVADALKSARLPALLSGVFIERAPQIAMGSFSNAINVGGAEPDNAPWFYEGDGSINGANDTKWTATMTLRRYPKITSGKAIDMTSLLP